MSDPRPISKHGWTLELRGEEISDITFGGVRLLRAIRLVVRDRDWRTIPCRDVRATVVDAGPGAELQVALAGYHRDGSIDLQWTSELVLSPTTLAVTIEARAGSTFERNRIGLVLLHPVDDAAREFRTEAADGSVARVRLPDSIAPHQPLRDLRSLEWTTHGVTARVVLEGDVFETEDQRNWTDASFKTYSTPLARPFPVVVTAGQRIRQSAHLTVSGDPTPPPPGPDGTLVVGDIVGTFPPLGVLASTGQRRGDAAALHAASVLLELDLRRDDANARLTHACHEAGEVPLDVRLVTDDPSTIGAAVRTVASHCTPTRLGVFDPATHVTEPASWEALASAAAEHLPATALVGGTRAHFTELNRSHHRLPAGLPSLTYSTTPQMHAVEREHVAEAAGMQRVVLRDARTIAAGRPIHLGPTTLRPRFNAVATTPAVPVVPGVDDDARDRTDPRQHETFAAVWLLAATAAVADLSPASLTLFEIAGPRGLLGPDGTWSPAARLFAELARHRGAPVHELRGRRPDGVHVLAVASDAGTVLHVANLASGPRTVRVAGPGATTAEVTLPGESVERLLTGSGTAPAN